MLALGETLNTPQLLRTTVLSPNNTYNRTIFLSLSLSLQPIVLIPITYPDRRALLARKHSVLLLQL